MITLYWRKYLGFAWNLSLEAKGLSAWKGKNNIWLNQDLSACFTSILIKAKMLPKILSSSHIPSHCISWIRSEISKNSKKYIYCGRNDLETSTSSMNPLKLNLPWKTARKTGQKKIFFKFVCRHQATSKGRKGIKIQGKTEPREALRLFPPVVSADWRREHWGPYKLSSVFKSLMGPGIQNWRHKFVWDLTRKALTIHHVLVRSLS